MAHRNSIAPILTVLRRQQLTAQGAKTRHAKNNLPRAAARCAWLSVGCVVRQAAPRLNLGTSAQASQPSVKPSTAVQRSLGFYSMHRPDGAKEKTARAL